ncbi:MAG: TMEM175 family protein [Candidatus Binataceae bacterium]
MSALIPRHPVSSGRLEAFSDGVFAIIITIMVLDLRVPSRNGPAGLLNLWPVFLSYFISYVLVATYWINHHQVFHEARTVDNRILWTNILLLFCISLVPFFTAYMGIKRLDSFSAALYSAVMLLCGVAFLALRSAIAVQFRDDPQYASASRPAFRKNLLSVGLYCIAIPGAYLSPALSLGIVAAIVISYFIPNAWID